MKLFTIDTDASKNEATYRDYAFELEAKIDSLLHYINWHNPNWVVLNDDFYSNKTLIDNGIVCASINGNSVETIIRPNMLKLHKGILQNFGAHTYYWFFSIDDVTKKTYNQLLEEEKTLIKTWYQKQTNTTNTPPDNILILDFSNITVILEDNNGQQYTNFILQSNNDSGELVIQSNNQIIRRVMNQLIAAEEGYIIFNNYLEENKLQDPDNLERQNKTHYKIVPMISSSAIYYPTSVFTNQDGWKWQWNYDKNGVQKYGKQMIFHFMAPKMRFLIYNETDDQHKILNMKKLNEINASNSILSFVPNGPNITPIIANCDGTTWDTFDDNPFCSKTIIKNTYEEILFDESINIDSTNFANYRIPRYNITIENLTSLDSVKPNIDFYLTIV